MNARPADFANDYCLTFPRVVDSLPGHQLDWLRQARAAAIERFAEQGFPTRRDEEWKYTDVGRIAGASCNVLPPPPGPSLAGRIITLALADCHRLVFVNGRLEPALSRVGRLPAGVVLGSLAFRLEQPAADVEQALAAFPPASAFVDLNLAFMADGAYIRLPPGAVIEAPIQLLFLASDDGLAVQPRNVIVAGAGSSAAIIEHHAALVDGRYLTNAVTDIVLEDGARIEHHKLQQEGPGALHIATVNVTQAANSHFVSGAYALGARLARTGIGVALDGAAASCTLDGLYVTDGRQHIDHHTCIEHRQPRCTSREFYKGVVNGASRAVFNGRVVVDADAQGSDARQNNHNLLLSDNAEIDSKPQLEIWADDVQCSHGATVGQLDEDQVFYLRARGIAEPAARALLTRAFAMEVVDRVPVMVLQERLDTLLQDKLPRQEGKTC
jgi:Fe-S cluster assembly protein SufD